MCCSKVRWSLLQTQGKRTCGIRHKPHLHEHIREAGAERSMRCRLVISDIDGTITKSDLLGHVLPRVGWDW